MTATPREPLEAALKLGDDHHLVTDLDRVRTTENRIMFALQEVSRAYRALLAQAPKVWTADEWRKNSPSGEYRTGNICEDGGMLWSMFYDKRRILESFVGYTHLYGPMDEQEGPDRIAPPPPEEKGG